MGRGLGSVLSKDPGPLPSLIPMLQLADGGRCISLRQLQLPTSDLRYCAEHAHVSVLPHNLGHLKHVVSRCPPIFTLPGKKIDATVRLFKEKCLFTTDQVMEILRSCPNVLLKEPSDLEYKFQVRPSPCPVGPSGELESLAGVWGLPKASPQAGSLFHMPCLA